MLLDYLDEFMRKEQVRPHKFNVILITRHCCGIPSAQKTKEKIKTWFL